MSAARKKTKPVLLMNRQTLIEAIAKYNTQGRKEDQARAERILDATLKELERRGIDFPQKTGPKAG